MKLLTYKWLHITTSSFSYFGSITQHLWVNLLAVNWDVGH